MYKLLLKLLGQKLMEKIKTWLKENGFVGFLAIAVAGVALFLGMMWLFWLAIGGFIGKNWEIIRKLWKESKLKEKVDDMV